VKGDNRVCTDSVTVELQPSFEHSIVCGIPLLYDNSRIQVAFTLEPPLCIADNLIDEYASHIDHASTLRMASRVAVRIEPNSRLDFLEELYAARFPSDNPLSELPLLCKLSRCRHLTKDMTHAILASHPAHCEISNSDRSMIK